MAKIYLCKDLGNGNLEMFEGSKGKNLHALWTVNRKLKQRAGVYASFARVNNKDIVVDFTAPNFLKELPKDAVRVPDAVAERLLIASTHNFGNLTLTDLEMKDFLVDNGYEVTGEEVIEGLFSKAIELGFKREITHKGNFLYKY